MSEVVMASPPTRLRIGELLVESGMITEQQLNNTLQVQKNSGGKKLGDILVDLEIITEQQLLSVLQRKLNVPIVDLRGATVSKELTKEISEAFAREKTVMPIRYQGSSLVIATADPLDYDAINTISLNSGRNVEMVLAAKEDIRQAIDRYYSRHQVEEMASTLNDVGDATASLAHFASQDFDDVESRVGNAPIVKFINSIIEQAYVKRASDIHIEPMEHSVRVRFRIDGDLIEVVRLRPTVLATVVTRIKIMANMDIAEKRVPLDGRFDTTLDGSEVSIRVSSMPTVFGEKIVMRLLADSKRGILTIDQLGMSSENMNLIYTAIKNPNGIILVTGPTGSGKTTTLYSVLNELAVVSSNILSVEDPVEKIVPGVNQTQINVKAGLTFATGLRAILRQDPDKIMIGEIRDSETADIAARAAITGHLVLASLHTNSAAASFMRLVDMGAEPYIVASAVIAVVSQRLIKLVCPQCKEEYIPNVEDRVFLEELGYKDIPPLKIGRGCSRCEYTGNYGRTAVHEIVLIDNEIKQMIMDRRKVSDIEAYLKREKQQNFLLDDAIQLLFEGRTTVKEVMTLSYSQH